MHGRDARIHHSPNCFCLRRLRGKLDPLYSSMSLDRGHTQVFVVPDTEGLGNFRVLPPERGTHHSHPNRLDEGVLSGRLGEHPFVEARTLLPCLWTGIKERAIGQTGDSDWDGVVPNAERVRWVRCVWWCAQDERVGLDGDHGSLGG